MNARLVVGLGNPGPRYRETRHNLGFMVVDKLAGEARLKFRPGPGEAVVAEVAQTAVPYVLAKPETYMNRSGDAVRVLAERFIGSEVERLLVIHDDLDIEMGSVRMVRNGGSGGHRGVASVIESLNTDQFPRLKMGIGRPERGEAPEEFVLSPFYTGQRALAARQVALGAEAVIIWVKEGLENAMNLVNSPAWAQF